MLAMGTVAMHLSVCVRLYCNSYNLFAGFLCHMLLQTARIAIRKRTNDSHPQLSMCRALGVTGTGEQFTGATG